MERTESLDIFAGPGEMRARCRDFDWASTPLGPVASWSSTLRTAAQMVLAAGLPNVVLWGPELIHLYNDAYAPIIGAKHPEALGRGNRETWPEVWHINEPIFERVFAGETVVVEDTLYPLERRDVDGRRVRHDAYLTVAFSPIRDETGAVAGVLANVLETTRAVELRRLQDERERLLDALQVEQARLEEAFRRSPAFFAVLRGPTHVFERVNDAYHQLVGHRDILGRPLLEALPEVEGQRFDQLLSEVLRTGMPFVGRELPVMLKRPADGTPELRWVDFVYQPFVDADGTRSGIVVHGTDVTDHVLARREVERARDRAARLQSLTAALASATTQEQVADILVTEGRAAAGAKTAAIALRVPGAPELLTIQRHFGLADDLMGRFRHFPATEPLPAATCIREAAPHFLDSPAAIATRFPRLVALPLPFEPRSLASVPLAVAGETIGAMSFIYDEVQRFTAEDREFLLALGRQCGQALERARLFDAERAALAAAEAQFARFRAVQDASPDGFLLARAIRDDAGAVTDFEYVYANPAAGRLTAGTGTPLVGRRMLDVFPHLVETGMFARYAGVADGGEPVQLEMEYLADGLDAAYRIAVVRAAPEEIAITFSDISDRVRLLAAERAALAQARAAREHLGRVISQAPVSMYIARGREHRYEVVNEAWCAIVGKRPEEVVGRTVREVFPEVGAQGIYDLLERTYDSGETWASPAQRIVLERDGTSSEHFFNIVYQPLRDADGAVYAMAVVAAEVTELVQARRDAEDARGVAEAANRAKSEFLAVMSHELRTPLNAISGYAELIAMGIRGPVTPQQREDLERIQSSQQHLLGLINEVLNYAKLETGNVRFDLADVGVAAAVTAVEPLVLPQARERRLTLEAGGCEPQLVVRADREKLQQILVNLLSNAVKFTEPGGRIGVTCTAGRDAAGAETVRLAVRDTGIGIAPDKLEAIFEPFVQVGRALNRPGEGTGLGLAISRDLARGMGGDLTVESTPGVGSTFTLMLPRAR